MIKASKNLALFALALVLACDMSRPMRLPIPDTCPSLLPESTPQELWLDTTCGSTRCGLAMTQNGCTLNLVAVDCGLVAESGEGADWVGTLSKDGVVTFAPSENFGSCEMRPTVAEGLLSFECTKPIRGCGFDVYPITPQRFETDRLTLYEAECPRTSDLLIASGLNGYAAFSGCLGALTATEDQVIVAEYSGKRDLRCGSTVSTLLHFVDPETLRTTSTATAPDCLSYLIEKDGQLLGLAHEGGAQLVRLDSQGALLSRTPIPLPTDANRFPIALRHDLQRNELLALFVDGSQRNVGKLLVFDEAFRVLRTVDTPPAVTRGAYVLDAGRLVIGIKQGMGIAVVDTTGETSPQIIRLDVPRFVANNPGFFSYHPTTDRLLVSATGDRAALWSIRGLPVQAELQAAVFYEEYGFPWATSSAPWNVDHMLVGVTFDYTEPAKIAAFDVAQNRFLPGAATLGLGTVSAMVTVGQNVFALLPWSGELARVRPR